MAALLTGPTEFKDGETENRRVELSEAVTAA